jgi:hypothetical protein
VETDDAVLVDEEIPDPRKLGVGRVSNDGED